MRSGLRSVLMFTICGYCFVSPGSQAATDNRDTADFVLVKEDHGISLYERWYSVTPDLQAREIKATFRINAQPHAAVALIKDEARGRLWNKNTEAYQVVHENEAAWFGYIQYDLPWPVSNQDCVLQYSQNSSGNTLFIEFRETVHPDFPIKKRVQRIPQISGKWIITTTGDAILVEYYITTTPSATLPPWLTDPIIRNNLIETLDVFRKILETNG